MRKYLPLFDFSLAKKILIQGDLKVPPLARESNQVPFVVSVVCTVCARLEQIPPSSDQKTHVNFEVPQLLPRREVDDVLVNPCPSLQQLLVQEMEDDLGARLGVHGHAEVVRVTGRDAHVTWVIVMKNGVSIVLYIRL